MSGTKQSSDPLVDLIPNVESLGINSSEDVSIDKKEDPKSEELKPRESGIKECKYCSSILPRDESSKVSTVYSKAFFERLKSAGITFQGVGRSTDKPQPYLGTKDICELFDLEKEDCLYCIMPEAQVDYRKKVEEPGSHTTVRIARSRRRIKGYLGYHLLMWDRNSISPDRENGDEN